MDESFDPVGANTDTPIPISKEEPLELRNPIGEVFDNSDQQKDQVAQTTSSDRSEDNIFTEHYQSVFVIFQLFEGLIKMVAPDGAILEPPVGVIFGKIQDQETVPSWKSEMDTHHTHFRLPNLGTSVNPLNEILELSIDRVNVISGSVSLPITPDQVDPIQLFGLDNRRAISASKIRPEEKQSSAPVFGFEEKIVPEEKQTSTLI